MINMLKVLNRLINSIIVACLANLLSSFIVNSLCGSSLPYLDPTNVFYNSIIIYLFQTCLELKSEKEALENNS